jgi:D-tyrosyl-tRNA(Tyr) deacylase
MSEMKKSGVPIESGEFGAMMDVELVNNGPVTFVLNSKD